MGKINAFCAGIDVGKRFLLCCALTGAAGEEPRSQTRRFDATVQDLVHLRDWLSSKNITHVVMESTGSYWRPIHNILDDGQMEVLLANSQHVKNLRGHKTDRNDARWLAHYAASLGLCPGYDFGLVCCDDSHDLRRQWPGLGRVTFDRFRMGTAAGP